MSRFRCHDCGCLLTSSHELEQHRLRTHPSGRDLLAVVKECGDQWTMIDACCRDQQFILLALALDNHIASLQKLRAAAERMVLG